jgi:hypothetical protein
MGENAGRAITEIQSKGLSGKILIKEAVPEVTSCLMWLHLKLMKYRTGWEMRSLRLIIPSPDPQAQTICGLLNLSSFT